MEVLTFDCAGTNISNKFGQPDSRPFHFLEGLLFSDGHWGFFDDLLMTTLDRAITPEQRYRVAILIGQQLNFQVTRLACELHYENGRTWTEHKSAS
jgi:hypothetical protein